VPLLSCRAAFAAQTASTEMGIYYRVLPHLTAQSLFYYQDRCTQYDGKADSLFGVPFLGGIVRFLVLNITAEGE